ncbi:MAG TPA: insulinase family protein, partial [Candidatus Cloacimonadota bacterium]|nr:insulinase family protein [Candidatus Cloacimonadota bacterium]
AQFPDSPYGFESGGDPEVIPRLSFEQFLAFWEKYYHPTNSKIFLYGDLDIEESLALINNEYLNQFDKAPACELPALQKPFEQTKRVHKYYPIDKDRSTEGLWYLSLNFTFGHISDYYRTYAFALLADFLLNSSASSLRILVQNSGLAEESSSYVATTCLQPTMSMIFKHVKQENLEKLEALVMGELKRLATEGFDKKLLEASIAHVEFYLREGQSRMPKGLIHQWTMAESWQMGYDPIKAIAFEDLLVELKRGLTEPYYEKLVQEALLDNPHSSVVVLEPKPGMNIELEEKLRKELAEYKAKLSPAEIQELVQQTQDLLDYQNTPDKPEDLQKIPVLSLKDIDPKQEEIPREIQFRDNYRLLRHPLPTNGIAYLKMYFDLSHASEDDLPWLKLYCGLRGLLDTENYGFADLSNEIDINTGDIGLSLSFLSDYDDPDLIHKFLVLYGKAVMDKYPRMLELMREYAQRPVFADTQRIKTLIRQSKANWESYILQSGMSVAYTRMLVPFSQLHHFNDLTGGLSYFHFLCDLEKNLDARLPEIVKNMQTIKDAYFTRRDLLISLTADDTMLDSLIPPLDEYSASIPLLEPEKLDLVFVGKEVNEAITAPVKVQYVAKGGNFFRKGFSFSGKLWVLKNLLHNDFLYKEIRMKGGAYGFTCNFTTAGHQYFASYQDPNLVETLDVYDRVAEYLRNYEGSEDEILRCIIGTIATLDYPMSPELKGGRSTEDYITGFSHTDRQQIRTEILDTKPEDIRSFAPMIESLMEKNHFAVYGSEQKITENKAIFDIVTPVFKA